MSQRSGPIPRGRVLLSVCPRWMRAGGLARCPPGGTVLWQPSSQGPGSPLGRVAFGANALVTGDCRSYLGATSLHVPCSCSGLVLQCLCPPNTHVRFPKSSSWGRDVLLYASQCHVRWGCPSAGTEQGLTPPTWGFSETVGQVSCVLGQKQQKPEAGRGLRLF